MDVEKPSGVKLEINSLDICIRSIGKNTINQNRSEQYGIGNRRDIGKRLNLNFECLKYIEEIKN